MMVVEIKQQSQPEEVKVTTIDQKKDQDAEMAEATQVQSDFIVPQPMQEAIDRQDHQQQIIIVEPTQD